MKKIIMLVLAVMCLFMATANAAEVLALRWTVENKDLLKFSVEMNGPAEYNVSLNGKQLTLTVSAPLIKGTKFSDKLIIKNSSLAKRFTATSSATGITVNVPLNMDITEKNYKVSAVNNGIRNKFDNIILYIAKPGTNIPTIREFNQAHERVISRYKGTWYDEYGQVACVIDRDFNFTEKGKTSKVWDIGIARFTINIPNKDTVDVDRNVIVLNDKGKITERLISEVQYVSRRAIFLIMEGYPTALQMTKKVDYSESIGGVHLGMPRRMVEQMYGKPDSTDTDPLNFEITRVKYNKDDWDILYWGDRVYEITLHNGSTRRFDKSGLSCHDSLASFASAYHLREPIDYVNPWGPMSGYLITPHDLPSIYQEYLYFVEKGGDIILTYNSRRYTTH